MEENSIIVKPENPVEQMRQATDVAGACHEIVNRTVQEIQGKKYVRVEGWQAICNAHGCAASSGSVERVEGGFRAIGQIRRRSDGVIIAEAEGFVGDDEPQWAGKPQYAKRAMAQTRAISRACRSAFAHVVVLIDENLLTTPAEEVPASDANPSAETSKKSNTTKPTEVSPETPIGVAATKEHRDVYFKPNGKKSFIKEFGVELFKHNDVYVYAPIGTYDRFSKGLPIDLTPPASSPRTNSEKRVNGRSTREPASIVEVSSSRISRLIGHCLEDTLCDLDDRGLWNDTEEDFPY
ncbi:hypothetical protein FH587_04465 (plasmid) [Leptospira interrogans]|uniref:hypothetical protein n=1 Tax=Leptospira interrogans TaxID=173 RepID=UPI001F081ABC|nr:hypothetical protein [Leptospira interrogans]UML83070.1 hypothetical protein FH587_04305 [Leptospira interrogans]UML83100.1 hypothetical protein FH587_04465 [Leptospira interrogans]